MQKEDKYFTASLFFAVTACFTVFSALHHSLASTKPTANEPKLVGTTRAQVIGATGREGVQANRRYVLVEFGDYQCPPCRAEYDAIREVVAARQPRVGFVFRHYPLMQTHPAAFTAALYVEAAREQGKFEQMHTLVYSDAAGVEPAALEEYANRLHLNMVALHASMRTTAKARVRADMEDAQTLNITATPTLILCGPSGSPRHITFQELEQSLPK